MGSWVDLQIWKKPTGQGIQSIQLLTHTDTTPSTSQGSAAASSGLDAPDSR